MNPLDTPAAAAAAAAVRPHLFGMTPPDLVAHLARGGVQCGDAEARRVLGHVVSEGRDDLRAMKKPVRAVVRDAIDATTARARARIVERVRDDADGFEKLLLACDDGAVHEAVRIPLQKPGRYTVCLSSQVGCAMGCTFCATGRLGFSRNLTAAEIVGAFIAVRDTLAAGERLSGAVFMGQGEPLANYDEVIQAARVLSDPCGGRIEAKAVSISTVGVVPMIKRYTAEGHKFRLIISLHSAIAARRRTLLPIAGAFALEDVAEAIRDYQRSINDRVTIAWTVMSGINTGSDEVDALKSMLQDVPIRLNLIDVNDARPDGFQRAPPAELARFLDELQALGQPIVRRYSGGQNRHAACGMLAAVHSSAANEAGPRPPE